MLKSPGNASSKKIFVSFLLLLTLQSSICQEITAHLELPGQEEIMSKTFLADKGIVLVTGNLNTYNPKCTLHYFDATGKELWKKVIDLEYRMQNNKTYVVVTPNGKTIYFILMDDKFYGDNKGYNQKKHYISQFTIDGKEKKFELEGREEFGKHLQTIFCDDSYLYYLATENGDESNRKMSQEKMILNRFSHADLSYKRIMLDLPAIGRDDANFFWSLIGQKGEEKWLASKTVDDKKQKLAFTVIPFDPQGNLGPKALIEIALGNERKLRPILDLSERAWENFEGTTDFVIGTTQMFATKSAFGHIKYDDRHDCFYVYGLFGSDGYNRNIPQSSKYEGFYVHKFDRSGNNVWKVHEATKMPFAFKFRLMPAKDGVIANSEISTIRSGDLDEWQAYGITGDGKSSFLDKSGEYFNLETHYSAHRKLRTLAYIQKEDAPRRVQYFCFQNSSNELLIRFDRKTGDLDVLNFNN